MDIRGTLEALFKGTKIDKELAKRVREYRVQYLITNAEFFSKPLTGTVKLFFKTSEVTHFFEDVLGINEQTVIRARKEMDGLDLSHKVASDHFNLTLFKLTSDALQSKLPIKVKNELAKDFMLIFVYRTLAALVSSRFNSYQASPEEAYATYENLSDKFILKKLKSWAQYAEYRADAMLSPKGLYRMRIERLPSDRVLTDTLVALQSAIASTFNRIYSIHLKTVENKDASKRDDNLEDDFGTDSVGSVTDSALAVIERVLDAVPYSNFYDTDIFKVAQRLSPQTSPKVFEAVIRNLQKASTGKSHRKVNQFIRDLLTWCFQYLNDGDVNEKDLTEVLAFIRGGLSASRTVDGALIALRESGNEVIKEVTGKRDMQIISVYRNAVSLYIFIFAKMKA